MIELYVVKSVVEKPEESTAGGDYWNKEMFCEDAKGGCPIMKSKRICF